MNWYNQALAISRDLDINIVPLWDNGLPASKLNPNKHPDLPPNKLPSKDPAIIKTWAEWAPAYGVVAGDDVLIVDVDVKEGQNGKASLKLMVDNGLPTNTLSVKTPSGGLHLYFKKPTHYTPAQGVGLRVLFDDDRAQKEWDDLQERYESSGIDTRYGWGYVVGPGSVTKKGTYVPLTKDNVLNDIPATIMVGRKGSIRLENQKAARDKSDAFKQKVEMNRNNDALNFTNKLSMKDLSDGEAKILIKAKIETYDNEDGEAPTFDEVWDMYIRALDKKTDIIRDLIKRYVYIIKGERIFDTIMRGTLSKKEFVGMMSSRRVVVINSDGKPKSINPANAFLDDPDRPTVDNIIYDPRLETGLVLGASDMGYTEGNQYYNIFAQEQHPPGSDGPSQLAKDIHTGVMGVIDSVLTDPDDKEWFMKWAGAMLHAPEFKPAWSIHIFSRVRGVGKDTIANILRVLYGQKNVCNVGSDIFVSQFNRDLFLHGLAVLSDFTSVTNAKSDQTSNAFKQISGTTMYSRRDMYCDATQAPINIRFLFLSNNGMSFPIDAGDRRMYLIESMGQKLEPALALYAQLFINHNNVKSEQLKNVGIEAPSDEDIHWARWLVNEEFKKCGYEQMLTTPDSPRSETKKIYVEASESKLINTLRRHIAHRVGIFCVDIVTKESLSCYLQDVLGFATKVEYAIHKLEDAGIIKICKNEGSKYPKYIRTGLVVYDKDLDLFEMVGEKHKSKIYTICNHQLWVETIGNGFSKEYSKMFKVQNISKGFPAPSGED